MLIISLEYPPESHKSYCAWSFKCMCNNRTAFKLQKTRIPNAQFAVYISDTLWPWNKVKIIKPTMTMQTQSKVTTMQSSKENHWQCEESLNSKRSTKNWTAHNWLRLKPFWLHGVTSLTFQSSDVTSLLLGTSVPPFWMQWRRTSWLALLELSFMFHILAVESPDLQAAENHVQ